MTLEDLATAVTGARVIGNAAIAVRAVRDDSREVEPGDVFVAVRGIRADGHAFISTAIERGAAAIVVEREMDAKIPQVIVPNGAAALGAMIARSLGDPARAMTLVGVTGTNGKTTTTYLVEAILRAAGHATGVIGTVSYRWGGQTFDAPYTTPTPRVLHETFAKMKAAGVTHVVMEVSSAALAMERMAGTRFAVAAFSNLTQDHLDVHGSMAGYAAAKRRLFAEYLDGTAVVNVDDPAGEAMANGCAKVLRVSIEGSADVWVTAQSSTVRGITATIATPRGTVAIVAKPLIGKYNVENLALATGIAEALGIDHAAIADGIAALAGVPGRVERVPNDADLDIFVDYAHTPDALVNVLSALRPLTRRRLICVVACGGDRDPTKRPKMGAAVAELADLAVVTSDNPRTEDPRAIIDAILPSVPRPAFVDVDRRTAIRAAIDAATPGDVVVIAGKGHEDYQILGTTKIHFDDRVEAKLATTLRAYRMVHEAAHDADKGRVKHGTPKREPDGFTPAGGSDGQIFRVVIDSRIAAPGDLYVSIRGETHDGHLFADAAIAAGASAVMVERELAVGVPQIIVGDARLALGKLAHAHRMRWAVPAVEGQDTKQIVAITGSAGKTTTKELAGAALAAAGTTHAAEGSLNNETGVPLTLLGLRAFHQFGVIEMGMRGAGQIEYLTKIAEPDVAVVVNAGTAHIELLGSTEAIARAKAEIWLGLRDGGTIVYPFDDPRLLALARTHRPHARIVSFGEAGADIALVGYEPLDAGGRLVIEVFGQRHDLVLGLVGRHAAIDACAAIAAAHAAGASIDQALSGLARARPAAMRGEIVDVADRHVIVDCYNANPASMAAALRTLAERSAGSDAKRLAVVGDMLELGGHADAAHREVGALARELGLDVIALGTHGALVVDAAGHAGHAELAADPAAAAARALALTKPGDWILLKASRGMKLERVLVAMRELATSKGGA